MAENKDQKRYVMVEDPDRNIYMFEEKEFNENFELDAVNPRQCRPRNSPSHKDRWDSFLCNNELAHAKSWFHYGKYPRGILVTAVYYLFPQG